MERVVGVIKHRSAGLEGGHYADEKKTIYLGKDMIIPPLEQFNICPLWAFALVDVSNFEIVYAKLLICAWLVVNGIAGAAGTAANHATGILAASTLLVTAPLKLLLIPLGLVADFLLVLFSYSPLRPLIGIILDGTLVGGVLRTTSGHLESLFSGPSFLTPNGLSGDQGIPLEGALAARLSDVHFAMVASADAAGDFIWGHGLESLFDLSAQDFSYLILSLNTSTVWLLFITVFTAFIFRATLTHAFLIPKNSWQAALESMYVVVLGMVDENAGPKLVRYFPLIFTIFILILTCNLLGMIPYSFTVTSHLVVTFCTALAGFVGLNIIGIMKNRSHFLSLFFPPGAPMALAPLLVFIEFVSYVFRVLSLSIRLFANLMSGHTLLKILSGFAWAAVSFYGIYLIPVFIIFLVTGLELGIAMIQAYIFSVLLCIYLNDAVNLH